MNCYSLDTDLMIGTMKEQLSIYLIKNSINVCKGTECFLTDNLFVHYRNVYQLL